MHARRRPRPTIDDRAFQCDPRAALDAYRADLAAWRAEQPSTLRSAAFGAVLLAVLYLALRALGWWS